SPSSAASSAARSRTSRPRSRSRWRPPNASAGSRRGRRRRCPRNPMNEPLHTVLSVLRGAEEWLARRGVEAPRRSAELLLGKVLGCERLQLYMAHDRPRDEDERAALRALVARRARGEPVAHLLGSWSF